MLARIGRFDCRGGRADWLARAYVDGLMPAARFASFW